MIIIFMIIFFLIDIMNKNLVVGAQEQKEKFRAWALLKLYN
jgi:hypothetical protein